MEAAGVRGRAPRTVGAAAAAGPRIQHYQSSAEISSKMCNISNSHGRARKARLGNLRSEGYEMGLAKGRAFSAKRSVGHFRVGSEPSAIPKNAKSRLKVCTFFRFTRNLLFIVSVGSENILSRKLHVFLKE